MFTYFVYYLNVFTGILLLSHYLVLYDWESLVTHCWSWCFVILQLNTTEICWTCYCKSITVFRSGIWVLSHYDTKVCLWIISELGMLFTLINQIALEFLFCSYFGLLKFLKVELPTQDFENHRDSDLKLICMEVGFSRRPDRLLANYQKWQIHLLTFMVKTWGLIVFMKWQ